LPILRGAAKGDLNYHVLVMDADEKLTARAAQIDGQLGYTIRVGQQGPSRPQLLKSLTRSKISSGRETEFEKVEIGNC